MTFNPVKKIDEFEPVKKVDEDVELSPSVTDPDYGKYTLGRTAAQVGGGILGGAAMAPSANPGAIIAGAGLGGSMAGQVYDLSREALGEKKPESLMDRATTAAWDFNLDVISQHAFKAGYYGLKKVGGFVVDSVGKKIFPKAELLNDFKEFGIEPTVAQATGSRPAAIAENALSDYYFSAGVFQKNAQKQLAQLEWANNFIAQEYGDVLSKEELGLLYKKQAPVAIEKLRDVYGKIIDKVSAEVGNNPQALANTLSTFNQIEKEAANSPRILEGIKKLRSQYLGGQGSMPFESIKLNRTDVGNRLSAPDLPSKDNIPNTMLKRIYGALSSDMDDATVRADMTGQTNARWRAADKYYQTKMNRDIPILEEIIKKGYNEDAWNVMLKSSQTGGSRLNALFKGMTEAEREATSGTVFNRMGYENLKTGRGASKQDFSLNTFINNWDGLSESAKNILFMGTRYAEAASEIDKFVPLVRNMKGVDELANKSKTGSVLMLYSVMKALGGAALGGTIGYGLSDEEGATAGAIATGVGLTYAPYKIAKLMTSPRFVNWLGNGIKISSTNPNALSSHLSRLMVLRFEPEIQNEVDELITSVINK